MARSNKAAADEQSDGTNVDCSHPSIDNVLLEAYVFDQVIAGVTAGTITPHPPSSLLPRRERMATQIDDLVARKRRNDDAYLRGAISRQGHLLYANQIRAMETPARAQLDIALGQAQFDAVVADGLDWRTWSSARRRSFLTSVITRIEIGPHPDGRKRSPMRPKNVTREDWVKSDDEYWDRVAPFRIRIVY